MQLPLNDECQLSVSNLEFVSNSEALRYVMHSSTSVDLYAINEFKKSYDTTLCVTKPPNLISTFHRYSNYSKISKIIYRNDLLKSPHKWYNYH